jgi:branched-chain amino acid transport system permease protein
MDLAALASCLTSPACIVTQSTGGLIIGMLLFLVAAGLTLIFGVLKVINFTHGSFYMLGAYFALTIFQLTGSYTLTILGAGAATALVGLVFERLFISRVYGQNVLMQLLVCYGSSSSSTTWRRSSGGSNSSRWACRRRSRCRRCSSPAAWCRRSICS